jgi:hypothetical protein
MTMWRPTEAVEEDVSDVPAIDLQNKRRRSRRRAWRDGLSEQTVVANFEDVRAYRAFERALIVSVDPRSVIELELVHRLASLMWRLRRASAIETGLFEIQGECPLALRHDPSRGAAQSGTIQPPTGANGHSKVSASSGPHDPPVNEREPLPTSKERSLGRGSRSRSIAQCFLHLSNLDPALFDRVGSYEARLWRQAAQTIWTLDAMRRPAPAPTRRPFRRPLRRLAWDAETE